MISPIWTGGAVRLAPLDLEGAFERALAQYVSGYDHGQLAAAAQCLLNTGRLQFVIESLQRFDAQRPLLVPLFDTLLPWILSFCQEQIEPFANMSSLSKELRDLCLRKTLGNLFFQNKEEDAFRLMDMPIFRALLSNAYVDQVALWLITQKKWSAAERLICQEFQNILSIAKSPNQLIAHLCKKKMDDALLRVLRACSLRYDFMATAIAFILQSAPLTNDRLSVAEQILLLMPNNKSKQISLCSVVCSIAQSGQFSRAEEIVRIHFPAPRRRSDSFEETLSHAPPAMVARIEKLALPEGPEKSQALYHCLVGASSFVLQNRATKSAYISWVAQLSCAIKDPDTKMKFDEKLDEIAAVLGCAPELAQALVSRMDLD